MDELCASAPPPVKEKEKRDPYDALRPWSALTHGIGAILSAFGTLLLLVLFGREGNAVRTFSLLVYGVSMMCLYTSSTLYHALRTGVSGRILLRKLDHCAIFLLIAGSYTPVCLIAVPNRLGITLLLVVWLLAAAGMLLTLLHLSIPRYCVSIIYLGLGWLSVLLLKPLTQVIPLSGVLTLLLSGILYTVGGVMYALKRPLRDAPRFGCHEVFHVFILLGSVVFYLFLLLYIFPL